MLKESTIPGLCAWLVFILILNSGRQLGNEVVGFQGGAWKNKGKMTMK